MSDPIPATKLDPNVWYHIAEQAVAPNYKNDFKAMLQTTQDAKENDTTLHVWPVQTDKQAQKAYWKFQPVDSTLGSLINVHSGTKFHLDCIPDGPVFMSPDVDETPYQTRQHSLMKNASSVNDKAFGTTASEVSSTSSEDVQLRPPRQDHHPQIKEPFIGQDNWLHRWGCTWRHCYGHLPSSFLSMEDQECSSPGSTMKSDKGRDEGCSVVPPYEHFSPEDVGRFPEMYRTRWGSCWC
ncbi:transmembrane alpha-helix domain-containing protein [Fusarium pseudoanthophilum]|uniref:Transmembrane alpha-helix domain-containing protein n=1 Tax=Fusarium pseudoanthophilum TaxID=48495 RepID=A0A8H5PYM3_9HYPO|nr:transmembrane alpha-helix domain-containing protein [Fusarium pseudoanthophilum]